MLRSAPKTAAQAYLKEMSSQIGQLNSEVQYFIGGFEELSGLTDESRDVFYEMSKTQSYRDAKIDTAEDIALLEKTQNLIDSIRLKKAEFTDLPEDLHTLSNSIDNYLDQNEAALNTLMTHQKFKQQMLEASGDSLDDLLLSLEDKAKKDELSFPEDLELFEKLAIESQKSADRFNSLTDIPESEYDNYESRKDYQAYLARSLDSINTQLNAEVPNMNVLSTTFASLGNYTSAMNEKIKSDAEDYVKNSKIIDNFKAADESMQSIKDETNRLSKKYGVTIDL